MPAEGAAHLSITNALDCKLHVKPSVNFITERTIDQEAFYIFKHIDTAKNKFDLDLEATDCKGDYVPSDKKITVKDVKLSSKQVTLVYSILERIEDFSVWLSQDFASLKSE